MADPRHYQIGVLCLFVVFGRFWLGFDFSLSVAVAIICTALVTQQLLFGAQLKSALISSLSLVLLLRTDSILLAGLAAAIAIVSKRYLRMGKHHIFNPSAFALVVITFAFPGAWLAPGQWGPMGLSVLMLAGAGLLVVSRAQRVDVALAFFVTYALIVLGRGIWLGDPLAIAMHQLQNGALIVFAFFMITDPKTTAATPELRVLQGVAVALLAVIIQFGFYQHSAPLFSLVLLAPLFALPMFHKESTDEKNNLRSVSTDSVAVFGQRAGFLRVLRRQG